MIEDSATQARMAESWQAASNEAIEARQQENVELHLQCEAAAQRSSQELVAFNFQRLQLGEQAQEREHLAKQLRDKEAQILAICQQNSILSAARKEFGQQLRAANERVRASDAEANKWRFVAQNSPRRAAHQSALSACEPRMPPTVRAPWPGTPPTIGRGVPAANMPSQPGTALPTVS